MKSILSRELQLQKLLTNVSFLNIKYFFTETTHSDWNSILSFLTLCPQHGEEGPRNLLKSRHVFCLLSPASLTSSARKDAAAT